VGYKRGTTTEWDSVAVREESESVAICSPFYSSPEAPKRFLQNVCPQHFVLLKENTNVLFNPGQICIFSPFAPASNVPFDLGLFAPSHLMLPGFLPSSNLLFKPRLACTFSPLLPGLLPVSNVLFKPGQTCPF
jgi:hypothetical protein